MEHFNVDEFKCPCCNENHIHGALIEKLDELRREYITFPIRITSGYRCRQHNMNVGGSDASSHLDGLAADIYCVNSYKRFFLLENLPKLFRRIGIAKMYIHVDIDHKKPDGLIWLY